MTEMNANAQCKPNSLSLCFTEHQQKILSGFWIRDPRCKCSLTLKMIVVGGFAPKEKGIFLLSHVLTKHRKHNFLAFQRDSLFQDLDYFQRQDSQHCVLWSWGCGMFKMSKKSTIWCRLHIVGLQREIIPNKHCGRSQLHDCQQFGLSSRSDAK